MKRSTLFLLLFLVLALTMSTVSLSVYWLQPSSSLTLYYESEIASAPVEVKLQGTYSSDMAIGSGLKGVVNNYRAIQFCKVTLTIGDYYKETKDVSYEVVYHSESKVSRHYANYRITVTATFDVPATKCVPYMTLKVDQEGEPIPTEGTLTFQIEAEVKISDVRDTISSKTEGIANIQIVGDVADYVRELPDEEMDSEGEFQPIDTSASYDAGGSNFISEGYTAFAVEFGIALALALFVFLLLRSWWKK